MLFCAWLVGIPEPGRPILAGIEPKACENPCLPGNLLRPRRPAGDVCPVFRQGLPVSRAQWRLSRWFWLPRQPARGSIRTGFVWAGRLIEQALLSRPAGGVLTISGFWSTKAGCREARHLKDRNGQCRLTLRCQRVVD
jgi:hypothetical protein